ncbi:putative fluoride ion transporter CrcB [Methyloligella halotolerans]|uniref:Fluoride-specific ion channel FluC n=1 Tax=Methyloligella halotolerans TaxID=1177755 RepID=A0A1E2S1F0_9HYPH|nr:fluoride efflux transporter CrcB [Methyloligella halotolerans]ODA68333.1 putative fluoride ion transporter CrcB [Methyloligella halotolerans]
MTIFYVAAGGAVGASLRYLVGVASGRLIGFGFPWGTLVCNVLGCFLMGVLIEAMATKLTVHNDLRAFLAVGLLGGFTTYSAFSADFALLLERGDTVQAILYVATTVTLALAGVFAGLAFVRAL